MPQVLTPSSTLVYDVLGLTPAQRTELYKTLTDDQFAGLLRCARRDLGTPYGLWNDDPIGFWRQVLRQFPWSKQIELGHSVEENARTVVPACNGPGKTWTAAMLLAWWCSVHDPSTVMAVTTAPKFRQVQMLLWPKVHAVHALAGLPGELNQVQWKIGGRIVAYGFSASDYDESAVQGIHEEHLLIIADEAGGISHTLGRALESITTGAHTRLLAIGNPPTDEEGTWFEERCQSDLWNTVRIAYADTPNATGEDVPEEIKRNLIDQRWVDDQIKEFGDDSSFVEARVRARFPQGSSNKTIPWGWIEAAMENEDPEPSTWIRLGIDVASDGGDEFVIARAIGNTVAVVHNSSGPQNANPTDVAGKALEAIKDAEKVRESLGEKRKVRVKVDSIGVGWAVYGLLKAWGKEGVHGAEIVEVDVSEKASDEERFANRRAEMWWTGRDLVRPQRDGPGGILLDKQPPVVHLEIDKRCAAQLNAPKYGHDSRGRVRIEKKDEIKRRGLGSPDRAEAVLMAVYEPQSVTPAKSGARQLTRTSI